MSSTLAVMVERKEGEGNSDVGREDDFKKKKKKLRNSIACVPLSMFPFRRNPEPQAFQASPTQADI
jgi:hypothetical protein